MPTPATKKTILRKIDRSKYEMTLAEFPMFILAKGRNQPKDLKNIEYSDVIKGEGGKPVERTWTVTWDSDVGFPTPLTFEVLHELFQIWKEEGFSDKTIYFDSPYAVMKRMGKVGGDKKQSKAQRVRFINDLKKLVGIRIHAVNAFWDNEAKAYVTKNFGLFDSFELYEPGKGGQLSLFSSWIQASDVLFESVIANSLVIANFDRQLFYKFSPTEQRLALYLSKVFRSQKIHRRNMMELAAQMPINSPLTKKVKQTFNKTCEGLKEKGFNLLASWAFDRKAAGEVIILFFRTGEVHRLPAGVQNKKPDKPQEDIDFIVSEILSVCGDEKSKNFYQKVAQRVSKDRIFMAIGDTKQAVRDGGVRNIGSYFTKIIKKFAKEDGINL